MEFRHELVIPNEDIPFRMFIFEGKDGNYKVSKHWHQSLELFLVEEGEIGFYINSAYQLLRATDFILVNSNEIHSIESPRPNRTIVLQIPLECFGEVQEEEYLGFERQESEQNQKLIQLIRQMFSIYEAREYGYQLKVKAQFYELLYLLLTEFSVRQADQDRVRQKKQLKRLSEVTQYMKAHYTEPLRLEELAEQFGFTPTYLSRMFRKYADINYRSYLLDLRVKYAVRELLNTEDAIVDIAIRNGFPDSRAFAKAFRRRYGCLPGEYRKSARKCHSYDNSGNVF